MNDAPPPIIAQIEALRVKYGESLPDRAHHLRELWAAIEDGADREEGLIELQRAAHNLAGSGATFGFAGVGEVARSIERLLESTDGSIGFPSDEDRVAIEALLDRLEQASTAPPQTLEISAATQPDDSGKVGGKEIFLVEDDADLARDMAKEIARAGYAVTLFPTLESIQEGLAKRGPGAIIMDLSIFGENPVPSETIARIRGIWDPPPPVVFLSPKNDFASRLNAVRAAAAYFPKPVDMGLLVEQLDRLTGQSRTASSRILIIDDDPAMAEYYASLLEAAGMITRTLKDPLAAMEQIIEFTPDLILIDLYMPGCSGLELAQVIRQQSAYIAIPLVFLSSENREEKQLSAISIGGDAFLTKPVSNAQLVASVSNRAERARQVRSLMSRDSLTGLLNHANIKQQLSLEVSRARRSGDKFVFVMIDIDHFKRVNDSHGHPTGDQVIHSLAQMLSRRLRKSDVIGRYGGEEFAVILLDTDKYEARAIIDDIAQKFANLTHSGGGGKFSVTFSSGIAEFPDFASDKQLNNAADKALYQAKHRGRNCVVLAQLEPKGKENRAKSA